MPLYSSNDQIMSVISYMLNTGKRRSETGSTGLEHLDAQTLRYMTESHSVFKHTGPVVTPERRSLLVSLMSWPWGAINICAAATLAC